MKLETITIQSFRGIHEPQTIVLGNFNVFVGKNDAGKSTILKALDCALCGSSCLPEDLNIISERQGVDTAIFNLVFSFDSLPNVVIDGTVPTNFSDEELLDEDGNLNLKYEVKFGGQTPKAKVFIKRKIYEDKDFFTKTNTQLNKALRDLEIDIDEFEEDTPDNNKAKRVLIRQKLIADGTEFSFEYEGTTSGRMKKVGDALKEILPRFQYFKADTPLDDSDGAIQKHFKKIAKDRLESTASEIQRDIEANVQEKLDRITGNMNVIFGDDLIKAEPVFDWSRVLDTKFISSREEEDLPLKSRGDGFRRVAMMAYFEYLAEEETEDRQSIIFGFEEPETFLHPELQGQLQEKLELVSENSYQTLLSTHSPVIVSKSKIEDVQHVQKIDGTYTIEPAKKQSISKDLGVHPDTAIIEECDIARGFVFVEGPSDVFFLHKIAEKYKDSGLIDNTFNDLSIKILPIGGKDTVKHWANLNLVRVNKVPFVIYVDSDKNSADSPNVNFEGHSKFVENEEYLYTKKRELENYITPAVINRVLERQDVTYTDWCKLFSESGGILLNFAELRYGNKKSKFVEFYSNHMSIEELQDSFKYDGNRDEFIDLFNLISQKLG